MSNSHITKFGDIPAEERKALGAFQLGASDGRIWVNDGGFYGVVRIDEKNHLAALRYAQTEQEDGRILVHPEALVTWAGGKAKPKDHTFVANEATAENAPSYTCNIEGKVYDVWKNPDNYNFRFNPTKTGRAAKSKFVLG